MKPYWFLKSHNGRRNDIFDNFQVHFQMVTVVVLLIKKNQFFHFKKIIKNSKKPSREFREICKTIYTLFLICMSSIVCKKKYDRENSSIYLFMLICLILNRDHYLCAVCSLSLSLTHIRWQHSGVFKYKLRALCSFHLRHHNIISFWVKD